MTMLRLFVAVDLPETVKETLVAMQRGLAGAKWVTRDQMHLTLHFLGEVSEDRAELIHQALESVQAEAFMMALRGTGTFPSQGKARVLWAGIPANPLLIALHAAVGAALKQTGYQPEERPYSPHITLARFKEAPSALTLRQYLDNHRQFHVDSFPVEQFILYRSTLAPGGAIYQHEHVYPLNVRKF